MKKNTQLIFNKNFIGSIFCIKTYANKKSPFVVLLFLIGLHFSASAQFIDLELKKNVTQVTDSVAGKAVFTLIVQNNGIKTAKNINIRDKKPEGTQFVAASPSIAYDQYAGIWHLDSLKAGQSISLQYTLTILSEGAITSEAELLNMQGTDIDSTPNNGALNEDDMTSACLSIPFLFCKKEKIHLEAQAPDGLSDYKWYKDNILVATTQTYTINDFGSYYYTAATSNTQCSVELCCPIIVKFNTRPIHLVPTITQACGKVDEGKIAVFAEFGTPPMQYQWSNGATTPNLSLLPNGTYTVTVSDGIGCSITGQYTIDQCCNFAYAGKIGYDESVFGTSFNPALMVEIEPASGGVGTINYLWMQSLDGVYWSSIPQATASNYDPPLITQTTYYRRCIWRTGCSIQIEGNIIKKELKQGCSLAHSLQKTDISCNNTKGSISAIVVGGTAPYAYKWSNAATTATISNLSVGYYELTVTDAKGCTSVCGLKILNLSNTFTLSKTCTAVSCYGGSNGTASVQVQSGGTAPFSYKWSNGASSSAISNLVAGTYTVTVTDANSCSKTINVIIPQAKILTLTFVKKDVSCFSGNDGSVTSTIGGGTAPYQYKWNSGQLTPNITSLPTGIYSLTVTDANSCSIVRSVTITQPTALTLAFAKKDVSCNGSLDGSVIITPSGGTKPYSYSWTNNLTTNVASSLAAGTYKVTVTDAKGCIKTQDITINQPTILVATIETPPSTCVNGVKIVASGGTPPYKYSKDGKTFVTNPLFCNLTNTQNTFTVLDAKGCKVIATPTNSSKTGANNRNIDIVSKLDPDEKKTIMEMNLYPNPTDGLLNVNITGANQEEALQLFIYDVYGRVQYSQDIKNIETKTSLLLDLSAFISGSYRIVVSNNQGQIVQQQFLFLK